MTIWSLNMSIEEERTRAMLSSRDERVRSYLRATPSADEIVQNIATAFAGDMKRIMKGATDTNVGHRKPSASSNQRKARG
jgi:hypothetical protein